MKVRTIYVHPDDILRIRFVHDGARPTKYEWQARPRAGYDELVLQDLKPYSFTLSPQGLVKVAGATHPGVDAGKLAALEADAARMDFLDSIGAAYGFEDTHEGNRWMVDGPFSSVRAALDALKGGA